MFKRLFKAIKASRSLANNWVKTIRLLLHYVNTDDNTGCNMWHTISAQCVREGLWLFICWGCLLLYLIILAEIIFAQVDIGKRQENIWNTMLFRQPSCLLYSMILQTWHADVIDSLPNLQLTTFWSLYYVKIATFVFIYLYLAVPCVSNI